MPRILMLLPERDLDVTEVAVPSSVFRSAGFEVVYATERGHRAEWDARPLSSTLLGRLRPRPEDVALMREVEQSPEFTAPQRISDVRTDDFAGLFLPGGYGHGIRSYLASSLCRGVITTFFHDDQPVASIGQSVALLAGTIDPWTGRSVIHGRRVTAIPKTVERAGYYVTMWRLNDYYRASPQFVEDLVKRALGDPRLFMPGPRFVSYDEPVTVRDGNLVTARWPGDAKPLADEFVRVVSESAAGRRLSLSTTRIPELRAGMRVLEIGSGAGVLKIAEWAKRRGITLEAVAVVADDLGRGVLAQAAAKQGVEPLIRFEVANGFSLPAALGRFDVVLSLETLSDLVFSDASAKLGAARGLVDHEMTPDEQQSFVRQLRTLAPETIARRLCFDLLEHWRGFLAPRGTLVLRELATGRSTPELPGSVIVEGLAASHYTDMRVADSGGWINATAPEAAASPTA